ncbi:hypothetical protein SAMN05216486_1033 [bacterium JGI 053]|nr:hypothetical protein SAMN05216486_1033 [bacterium JGI 053]
MTYIPELNVSTPGSKHSFLRRASVVIRAANWSGEAMRRGRAGYAVPIGAPSVRDALHISITSGSDSAETGS